MTATSIIESLHFTFEVANDQKNLFTPAHTLYKCRITTPARRRFTFDYQCNPAISVPSVKDCLYCLLSDASSVDFCIDEADFLHEFGYIGDSESIRRGLKAFKACKRTRKALDRLFTDEELTALNEYFQDY